MAERNPEGRKSHITIQRAEFWFNYRYLDERTLLWFEPWLNSPTLPIRISSLYHTKSKLSYVPKSRASKLHHHVTTVPRTRIGLLELLESFEYVLFSFASSRLESALEHIHLAACSAAASTIGLLRLYHIFSPKKVEIETRIAENPARNDVLKTHGQELERTWKTGTRDSK